MIAYVKGRLVSKSTTSVIVECHGIAYDINISLHSFDQISDSENIMLYTHLLIREDAHLLYGFYTQEEREIFRLLITVSGIGANIARTILSSMSPQNIVENILAENTSAIQSVKGIGTKTAQRVIIDLKDKVSKTTISPQDVSVGELELKNDAISALEVLGYARKQTDKQIDKIIKSNPSISTEQIVKEVLKNR